VLSRNGGSLNLLDPKKAVQASNGYFKFTFTFTFTRRPKKLKGPESTVGTAAHYGLEDSGFEPQWGQEIFFSPDRLWDPFNLFYNRY
jgi:hypothetical protein